MNDLILTGQSTAIYPTRHTYKWKRACDFQFTSSDSLNSFNQTGGSFKESACSNSYSQPYLDSPYQNGTIVKDKWVKIVYDKHTLLNDVVWWRACKGATRVCVCPSRLKPPRHDKRSGVLIGRRDATPWLAKSACAYACNHARRVGFWRAHEGRPKQRVRSAAVRTHLLQSHATHHIKPTSINPSDGCCAVSWLRPSAIRSVRSPSIPSAPVRMSNWLRWDCTWLATLAE